MRIMAKRFVFCALVVLLPALALQAQTPSNEEESKALFAEGKAMFEKGDLGGARAKLLAAFKLNPGDLSINFYLGRAALESNDAETAVMAFERVLMINPDLERAKLELARSYFTLG